MAVTTLYTIAAAQGFLLAIALWHKTVNNSSNRVLSVWMLFMVFDLVIKVIYQDNSEKTWTSTKLLTIYFPFLYGSFFYIYVRTLIKKSPLRPKDLFHFSIFFILVSINIRVIVSPDLINIYGVVYSNALLYFYSISYVISGLLLVLKYRTILQQQKVNIEGIDLTWLMIMSYSQIIIWVIAVSQWLTPIPSYNISTIYSAVSLWIIITGYLSLSQHNVPKVSSIKTPKNDSNNSINDVRFDEVKIRLNDLFNNKNLHLQPSLTIGDLAKFSGYPEYLISLFINRVHGISFRDYINNLRINKAKEMLKKSNEKLTILDIAYECGFNSKSTFNGAFKKFTHMTPSQFKQQQESVVDNEFDIDKG
jgi:AraC-like DNA-binding protein